MSRNILRMRIILIDKTGNSCYTDAEGEVIFKKYSPLGELGNFAGHYAEALYRTTGKSICITDSDLVIAASGVPKKEILENKITEDVVAFMSDRCEYLLQHPDDKKYYLIQNSSAFIIGLCIPIIAEGDILGSVVFLNDDTNSIPTEADYQLAKTAAIFLGRQMEDWYLIPAEQGLFLLKFVIICVIIRCYNWAKKGDVVYGF